MEQSELFEAEKLERRLYDAVSALPPLPSQVSYFDDFHETLRFITDLDDAVVYQVHYSGAEHAVDFRRFSGPFALLLKHSFVRILTHGAASCTAAAYVNSMGHLTRSETTSLALASPDAISPLWSRLLARNYPRDVYAAAKALLKVMCDYSISSWSPSYIEYASKSLPLPRSNKYAGLRSGKAFLTLDQEASIVGLIDDSSQSVVDEAHRWNYPDLANIAMLVCAFQFGLRPVQIARLKIRDVKCREMSDGSGPAVHLSFPMVKQRSGAKTPPMVRRVKSEWTPIFVELFRRTMDCARPIGSRFFAVDSSNEAGHRIASVIRALVDDDEIGALHLRHSAAQRMVDAGGNHEELAAFLGHSDITTSLVYFDTSETQAERINRALGLSETFSRVARIAEDRFISAEELAALKGDQQIAAVPHGIPIAGIGGCASGQPACPYNPVLSCYTCRRFMPVKDPATHREVLNGLRSTVNMFLESSRGETSTPAYLQLQRAISSVQDVISRTGGGSHE